MKQKILKLIKILNKFTLDDILLMDNFDEDEVKIILADFEKFGVIKKISDTEYVFLKQLHKLNESEPIPHHKTITKPLITNLFSKENEQMIYDNATEKSKKILTKYYTILKLASSRRGDALKIYLANLAEEHPEYSITDMLDINGISRIFKKVKIGNFDAFLNTNVKLQLKYNIPLNLICKNLGYANFSDFEKRFNFLLPIEINKDLDILK